MAQWESKREQKKQARDLLVRDLHKKYPDLDAIDSKLSAYALDCVKRSLRGGAKGLDASDATYQALKQAREAVLASHGLTEAIYEPQWDCPICQDRGYVRPGVPCSCQLRQRREATYLASGLPEKYRDKTFDNFRTDVYTDPAAMEKKLARIHRFIDALAEGRPMGNLVLRGYVGRGKTHLSAAIANACIERDLTVVYRRVDDLLDLIRLCKFERGQDSEETIRTFDLLYNSDLLILDDFGAEPKTEFSIDELTRLIEERNLNNKSWIINTNLEYNDIEKLYDARLMERIDEKATVFRLDSPESMRREEARRVLDVGLI
ncbi:MAG: ATP-binding protein [Peptococcaceae bacterium]|nr:ATP-binding protein [Peptococcaceae bacterium]